MVYLYPNIEMMFFPTTSMMPWCLVEDAKSSDLTLPKPGPLRQETLLFQHLPTPKHRFVCPKDPGLILQSSCGDGMFRPSNLQNFGKGMDPDREPSFFRGYGKSFPGSTPNCQGMLMTGSAYIWIHLGSFLGGRTIFSPNWSVCWVPVFYIFLQHHVTLRKKNKQPPYYMLQIWNIYLPAGDSKWRFYPLVEGHLAIEGVT